MDIIQASVLALVQGITEFLPISSSAHLILLPKLLGWQNYLIFDVVVHSGTLCAVLYIYRKQLSSAIFTPNAIAFEATATQGKYLLLYMSIGSVPILMAGFLLHNLIESQLRTPVIIAAMTIIWGIFLWLANNCPSSQKSLTAKIALWVGLGQMLALIPGVSRAGITITVARFLGLSKRTAADFSFLLAIPAILFATIYEVFIFYSEPEYVATEALIYGFLIALISAFCIIRLFLYLVDKIGLIPFAIYRIILGTIILLIYL